MDHSIPHSKSEITPFEPVNQLELVVADVESFLSEWLHRIEQLQAISTTPDSNLRKRLREFEVEKGQWEAKRNRETQDIHQKAEELTKAWLRLEQEQRRFLQVRDSQSNGNRAATAESQVKEIPTETKRTEVPETSPSRPITPAVEETSSRRPSPLQGLRAGPSAVRQFEQLRREIQTSRRLHRRV